MDSPNNRGTAGSGVFCSVLAEVIKEEVTGAFREKYKTGRSHLKLCGLLRNRS
jgi:hypothetical protein